MSAALTQIPAVGTRLAHAGHLGTIRFVGPVDGTTGVWLGVEWDDPTRGKHDGVKDGRRYFTCLVPGAGSFIRPTAAGIAYGTSFLKALVEKYIEIPHGSSVEKVILGSSNGAIEVEAPGLDKVRGKLANLQRLREVSVDGQNVASSDAPGDIRRTCPGIRGLDLSKNLLPSWDVVASIVEELPVLEAIALNNNRLRMPSNLVTFQTAFANIKELQISSILVTWTELRQLVSFMPSLRAVEAGYNRLQSLALDTDPPHGTLRDASSLQLLNLDGNLLSSWSDICAALVPFQALERLILSSNRLTVIDERADNAPTVQHLQHLSLTANALRSWADIDRLAAWVPELSSLSLTGNPLVEDFALGAGHARQFTIAKLAGLTVLDGAAISAKERTDCELFYLSHVAKHGPHDPAARAAAHPRFAALCAKHAMQDAPPPAATAKQDTLGNRLFHITAHLSTAPPTPAAAPAAAQTQRVSALPTMSPRTLRLKLAKTFKLPRAAHAGARLWLRMPGDAYAELDVGDDGRDLAWWGLEDGCEVVLAASSS